MAELKTKETKASVEKYFAGIKDASRRKDCEAVSKMMQSATKSEPKMWGKAIVGFGSRHLKYASGRELDWLVIGLSSRVNALTLYLGIGEEFATKEDFAKLGKFKTGKGCLYINKLSDVDTKVLEKIIKQSAKRNK